MADCTCKGRLKADKVVFGQQVPERNHHCKQIMLTHRILSAVLRNTEFLVQYSVRNIVAGLIRIKAFTVGADISKLGHYTQKLYKLLLIHFIKITGYFGLDVLCCELIEFRECTECYAVGKNP